MKFTLKFTRLTPREQQIARLLATNMTTKEVAEELGISAFTVRSYIRKIAALLPGKGSPIKKIVIWVHAEIGTPAPPERRVD